MAGPRNATTDRSGSRYYSWRGENYYSVTTMLKGGTPTSYGLRRWDRSSVALGAVQEHDVLDTILKDCEQPDICRKAKSDRDLCPACDRACRWLMDIPFAKKDKAAELGTHVHEAVEAYILGKPYPPWRPEVKPRMEQFVRFLDDYKPVYEMTEASVYNRTHRYAGTLDAIVCIGGQPEDLAPRFILDMKSGKAVYEEVALQLAMYRYAEFVGMPDGSEAPMPQVDGAAALHLTDHDYTLVDVQADEEVFRFALHVREVYRWKTDVEKHVLRGPLRLGVSPVGPQLTMEEAQS